MIAVALHGLLRRYVGVRAAARSTELFCQVTGYGGTTQRVEQYSSTILDKDVRVRFAAMFAALAGISSRNSVS